ncbi:hypothetical protein D3C79_353120 [compost metagenome]
MRSLAVVFRQSALCDFTYLIQRSEQIKIQYLCPVHPVKAFDEGILRRLTRLDQVQHHPVLFCPCASASDTSYGPLSGTKWT